MYLLYILQIVYYYLSIKIMSLIGIFNSEVKWTNENEGINKKTGGLVVSQEQAIERAYRAYCITLIANPEIWHKITNDPEYNNDYDYDNEDNVKNKFYFWPRF